VLTGGYAQKFDPQAGWQQITGSQAMRRKKAAKAALGSRRERRTRHWTKWMPSTVSFGIRRR
ncbi:MAG TPA: hypothetical protein VF229_03045, partial [Burkholderiaceae bacterium]